MKLIRTGNGAKLIDNFVRASSKPHQRRALRLAEAIYIKKYKKTPDWILRHLPPINGIGSYVLRSKGAVNPATGC